LIRVILDQDAWLDGGKEYFVRGRIIGNEAVSVKDGIFHPYNRNLMKRGMVGACALVNCEGEFCPIRIINLANQCVHLFRGTHLGDLECFQQNEYRLRCMRSHNGSKMKLDKIISYFKPDLDRLHGKDRENMLKILEEYSDVFSEGKFDIGLAVDAVHRIETEDALPISCNPRRIPIGVEDKVDELVEQLLQHKIIRPSASPWNAPIVVVAKKDGDIRMCVDYRKLNAITKRPIFPIPEAQQLFDALGGASFFSTLDLSQGYHQVPVAEEDIPKTAFTTRRGQFEYLRMPFGLCSAPATFQRLMHTVLCSENWNKCLIHLHDILAF
jgi:hypothetical protein